MTIRTLGQLLSEHPLFQRLSQETLDLLAGCARNEVHKPGAFIYRTGEDADRFYIVRHGAVALENASVERGVLTIQTLGRGEVLGISWLVPPFRHHNDARAIGWARLVAIDARCLRDKCDQDHDLGYALMRRFLPLFAERLKQAELQLMDVYNVHR